MGLFSETKFDSGKDLYYHDAKAGIKMMEEGADSASEFRTIAYKCWESGDVEGYKKNKGKEAEKKAEARFNW